MKLLIGLFFISSIGFAFSYESRPALPLYTVESDVIDTTIKRGMCVVQGTVIDQNGTIVSGATVSNLDKRKQVLTGADGSFQLTISSLDTAIFMFHPSYGEIVTKFYDFGSRHRVTIRFNPRGLYVEPQTVKKPVIYLYADEPTLVNISVNHPDITFLYPAYEINWSVTADHTGKITDNSSGKTYPYLFWEAADHNLIYPATNAGTPGFMVATDTLISFLENGLTQLGLNATEQTDFITFWAPQLIQTPYVFIQFAVDAVYNEHIASLNVQPVPDSQRRIFMLYTPLNDPAEFTTTVVPQALTSFTRNGFTLVEWGGAEVSLQLLAH